MNNTRPATVMDDAVVLRALRGDLLFRVSVAKILSY